MTAHQARLQRCAAPLLLAAIAFGLANCSHVNANDIGAKIAADSVGDVADVGTDSQAEADEPDLLPDDVSDSQPEVKLDSTAADGGADVPYWISHDTDLSGLGVVGGNPFCANPYLEVQPNDPPHDPSCKSACPAPYPCTCGTCPWIKTPPMIVPRFDAEAIWTGEEVLIFGGQNQMGPGSSGTISFTAERWNPSKDKGFSFIELPFAVTVADQYYDNTWAKPIWTGSEALVFMRDHFFRFDPKTGVLTEFPLSPVTIGLNRARVFWVNETLLVWGYDRATSTPFKPVARIMTWTKIDGWQDVPFPSKINTGPPTCAAVLDGSLYVLDPAKYFGGSDVGLDPSKPVMMRYDVAAKKWQALPQTMFPDLTCIDGNVIFQAFPDGIVFIPDTSVYNSGTGNWDYLPAGEIWWKATGKWTAMTTPPLHGPIDSYQAGAIWTGSQFIIPNVDFLDPIVGDFYFPPSSQDYPTWPIAYDPYTDEFHYLTSVGYPKHNRLGSTPVYGNSEVFMLGGTGGWGVDADGARLWLPKP